MFIALTLDITFIISCLDYYDTLLTSFWSSFTSLSILSPPLNHLLNKNKRSLMVLIVYKPKYFCTTHRTHHNLAKLSGLISSSSHHAPRTPDIFLLLTRLIMSFCSWISLSLKWHPLLPLYQLKCHFICEGFPERHFFQFKIVPAYYHTEHTSIRELIILYIFCSPRL